jgi:outer membrane protein assembly factor BamB
VTDRLVVVGTDSVPQGHLYALDRPTGTVRWKLAFAGGVGAQILRRGDTAFAVSASGEVVAVDLGSGRIVWRTSPLEEAGDRSIDPVLDGDRLFVGWRPGSVEALDASTGRKIWRTHLGERLNTSLAVVGSAVVVGTLAGRLHRLSREDGSVLAAPLELKGMPYGDLLEAGGCLLALQMELENPSSQQGPCMLSCLDPSHFKARWSFRSEKELSTFRPLIHQGRAVVGWDGTLVSLNLGTGSQAWSCPLKGVPRGLGSSGENLYIGTLNGPILVLDPARCADPASPR